MTHFFISHATADKDRALTLVEFFGQHGVTSMFLDFDVKYGLLVGTHWERELCAHIEKSSAVALVLTRDWSSSCWCFAEYTQARAMGKTILPIVMQDIDEVAIAADIQRVDVAHDTRAYERLAVAVDTIVQSGRAGVITARHAVPIRA